MKEAYRMTNECEVKKRVTSGTAEEVALHRALEYLRPEGERICSDRYAHLFLGHEVRSFYESIASGSEMACAKLDEMNRLYPGTHNSIVARARYIDDVVYTAAESGTKQLVILGAGYDSRAYRMDGFDEMTIFEVDHPAMQAVKIKRVREIFGSLPARVKYVPVDIGNGDLSLRMTEGGYKASERAMFVMEGLIYYLEPSVVDDLLGFISSNSGEGSAVIFDYFPQSMVDGSCESTVGHLIHDRLMRFGEPLRFGIDRSELASFLESRGFTDIDIVESDEYWRTYFRGPNALREVCDLYSFAFARIKGSTSKSNDCPG